MSAEIHVGDIGTVLEATVKDQDEAIVDISTATVKQFTFSKPNGQKATVETSFSTNGTDGKHRYTSVSGTFDVPQMWRVQGFVLSPDGQWHSDETIFKVMPNL